MKSEMSNDFIIDRLRGAGVAATFSLAIHAGVALLALRHFGRVAITPELRGAQLELISADIDVSADAPETPPSPETPNLSATAPRVAAPKPVARRVSPAMPTAAPQASPATTTAVAEPGAIANSVVDSAAPRFTITLAKTTSRASPLAASTVDASSNSNSAAAGSANAPVSSANVDVPAKLRAGNVPAYTAAALAAGIEANVPLEIVVSESGVVASARALEHVGYGLDEAARQSVLAYRFTPALRSNRAVAVRMRWLMRFQLN
jgi:periplasmic protein TonB